jgi:hypothetical protein
MFCPDCAAELDDVAVSEPCPDCGGHRRSANAQAASATASITVSDVRAVGHSHLADGSERIDVGSRQFRSSSHAGPGAERQSFAGRSPQNEDDRADVCSETPFARTAKNGARSNSRKVRSMTSMRWLTTTPGG